MMNVVNIMMSFSSIKRETQETFNDSVKELVRIVKVHSEWIGKAFALVEDEKGNIVEKEIFQVFYEYNEETETDELTLWYDEKLMKSLGLSKVKID